MQEGLSKESELLLPSLQSTLHICLLMLQIADFLPIHSNGVFVKWHLWAEDIVYLSDMPEVLNSITDNMFACM